MNKVNFNYFFLRIAFPKSIPPNMPIHMLMPLPIICPNIIRMAMPAPPAKIPLTIPKVI